MTGISNNHCPLESYQGLLAARKLAESLNEKLSPDSEKTGSDTIKKVAKRLNAKFGQLSTSAPAILQTPAPSKPQQPKVVKKRKKIASPIAEQINKKLPKLSTMSPIRQLAERLNKKFCPDARP